MTAWPLQLFTTIVKFLDDTVVVVSDNDGRAYLEETKSLENNLTQTSTRQGVDSGLEHGVGEELPTPLRSAVASVERVSRLG